MFQKMLIIVLHMKIILVSFLLIWRIYYKISFEKFCEKQVGKMLPKFSKTPVNDKTPMKLKI